MSRLAQLSLLLAGPALCFAADVQDSRRWQRTYVVPAASTPRVIVDTVDGGIVLRGGGTSDRVEVSVQETWKASSAAALAGLKQQIRLDAEQTGPTVRLYVDGPFRCQRGCDWWDRHDRGQTRFDFDLRVPSGAAFELKTVNHGNILVENCSGEFVVRNVNGSIELRGLSGGGSAHTVNGDVRTAFLSMPRSAVSLKSVNGELSALLPPGAAADFRVKTMNGGIFSDFPDVSALPSPPVTIERTGSRSVYRLRHGTGFRLGAGGPEFRLETLNGDVRILRKGN